MQTREDKYSEEYEKPMSRIKKNESLYREMSYQEIENFDVNSNVKVLEQNAYNIDVDKIREMLDRKYREPNQHRQLANSDLDKIREINLDETREYDVNALLQKAREKKVEDYETDRLKNLRNTQIDILNNIELDTNNNDSDKEDKLTELINTITLKEEINKRGGELDPLDILTDLRGGENTVVVPPIKNDSNNLSQQENVNSQDNNEFDKSFYTTSNVFTQSDFDDFNDLKEDVESTKLIIKILIVLIIIALILGTFFILNRVLDWGLF